MVNASESDIVRAKENKIPIVICPRSNFFYGLKPNFKLLKKVGVNLLLGTDNAMLHSPIILDEINYLKTVSKEFSTLELLYMTTFGARKALNLDCDILGPNSKAEFVVLDPITLKPLYISV
jgi:cytosine/adenosine deaminase-related metal-dependent hydrolase